MEGRQRQELCPGPERVGPVVWTVRGRDAAPPAGLVAAVRGRSTRAVHGDQLPRRRRDGQGFPTCQQDHLSLASGRWWPHSAGVAWQGEHDAHNAGSGPPGTHRGTGVGAGLGRYVEWAGQRRAQRGRVTVDAAGGALRTIRTHGFNQTSVLVVLSSYLFTSSPVRSIHISITDLKRETPCTQRNASSTSWTVPAPRDGSRSTPWPRRSTSPPRRCAGQ